ncbi:MAG: hypothetical protein WCK65_03410 [Rhodospirillaceae bacterium]
MADIFQEVEEDLRRDRYERLARKYGGVFFAAVLLIVAATIGHVLWKNWRDARQQADTLSLAQAIDQTRDQTSGQTGVDVAAPPGADSNAKAPPGADSMAKVINTVGSGPGGLARFYQAGVKARTGDIIGAVALYESIASDGATRPLYRDLALLMAAQAQINTGDTAALTERLAPLAANASPWRYSARELNALLAARTGDRERAKTLFKQLADDNGAPAGLKARATELAAYFGRTP